MECMCELYFHLAKSICLLVVLLIDNAALIGIAVLFVICLVITLERFWNPEDSLVIQIKPTEAAKLGETVYLEGNVQFHHSLTCLKWQKYHNGGFVDINIHKPKYKGTTNTLQNPTLVLNDVDLDDEVKYRIEVQRIKSTEYSNLQTIHIVPVIEDITIEIFADQKNNEYYVGEDATINTKIQNHSNVLCATWRRKTEIGSQAINTTLQKYAGSNEQRLKIRECNESDTGTYFLLVACKDDMEYVTSNDLDLKVIKGYPSVSLNQVPEALYGTCVELQAKIRSFPKHDRMVWLKNKDKQIDISKPKYNGSLVIGDTPKLCIKDVDKNDDAKYELYVYNEFGKGVSNEVELKVIGEIPEVALRLVEHQQSVTYGNTINLEATITSIPAPLYIQWKKCGTIIHSDGNKYIMQNSNGRNAKLSIRCLDFDDSGEYTISVANALGAGEYDIKIDVKANTILFISGPVVISPTDSIQFQTIYPPNMDSKNGEWFKTYLNTTSKLAFGAEGQNIYTSSNKPTIQKIELNNAKENKGAYQLILGTTKSNIINVFVDDSGKFATEQEGNCLRFFSLQTVSGDAMRIAMDKMPGGFQLIWQKFTKFCKDKKGKWLEYIKQPTLSSTNALDISALYAMFRNSTTIPKPKRGWGQAPDVNDTNIEDDVERIHLYRNKISHANSAEMTTDDFNASALDLIGAIRRLTADDEQLIKKICEIMNKVFCKGKEMEKMMEDLKDFRKLTSEQEKLLKDYEDKEIVPIKKAVAFDKEIVPIKKAVACDKNLIHINGLTELYLGETAMFTAYIDSKVSTLSEVVWQRIDHQGTIYKIDVNDGKYKGSIVTFPSPRLYIHFVRKEDEGTYRLCVDTFNEEIQSSIELKVKKGECDEDSGAHQSPQSVTDLILMLFHEEGKEERNRTGNDGSREIGFHRVHDFNISLLHNNAIARKTNGEDINGICFTDRPVAIGEKIYIRVAETYAKWSSSMDFGLTNKNPNEIEFSPNEHASLSSIRKRDTDEAFNYLPDFNDVICFMLNSNATLSFSINDIDQPKRRLKHVSIHTPVWFSFDLYGKTRAIEISKKKPKNKPYNSFFREYSF